VNLDYALSLTFINLPIYEIGRLDIMVGGVLDRQRIIHDVQIMDEPVVIMFIFKYGPLFHTAITEVIQGAIHMESIHLSIYEINR
jgi:hypothetical protein